ncbi:acyltransferase family protein [Phycicoccus sp. HDW14]|nr:acyltransferase family protein [Phycicoccus sp. HDW14]
MPPVETSPPAAASTARPHASPRRRRPGRPRRRGSAPAGPASPRARRPAATRRPAARTCASPSRRRPPRRRPPRPRRPHPLRRAGPQRPARPRRRRPRRGPRRRAARGRRGRRGGPEDVERRVAEVIAYLRRRVDGDYTVDDFGYDEHFTENVFYPMLRPLYRHWFRVEVRGIENIPAEGGALVVSNHSGTVAVDSLMVQLAIHDEHPAHRTMRALGADLVFQTPFVGTMARRSGSTLATNEDAERLFARGELVGVFPEGFKGTGKPFSERYKLQRFGRGGFVSAALAAGVPIVPCSVVGAEEIYPILGNMGTLARVLGLPYAPVTPTWPLLGPLGMIPLPSKWIIEFGTPIETDTHDDGSADDPMLVFDLTDQVRETIQQTLYTLLMQRRSIFF